MITGGHGDVNQCGTRRIPAESAERAYDRLQLPIPSAKVTPGVGFSLSEFDSRLFKDALQKACKTHANMACLESVKINVGEFGSREFVEPTPGLRVVLVRPLSKLKPKLNAHIQAALGPQETS